MKKSYLVIGMGKLGRYLSVALAAKGCDVMIVDKDENVVSDIATDVDNAQIGDCTDAHVMESLGVEEFDACFVCIGDDFASALEITYLLKYYNAKHIVAVAKRNRHKEILQNNGASKVIYMERDMGRYLAKVYSKTQVKNYVEIEEGIPICEVEVPKQWINKKIVDLDIRNKYGINVIGYRTKGKTDTTLISADHIFSEDETILIVGEDASVDKFFDTELT